MTPNIKLTAKLPKHFWIPSRNAFITTASYLKLYKFCKENPGIEVKQTISKWWGGTTDDVLNEIWEGIQDRINLRQSINQFTKSYLNQKKCITKQFHTV